VSKKNAPFALCFFSWCLLV